MNPIQFTQFEVEQFATSTFDFNPLHLSEEYSRRTPFGRPIVHGIFALLKALESRPNPQWISLSHVSIEFIQPVFTETLYEVRLHLDSQNQIFLLLKDGERDLLKATITTKAWTGPLETHPEKRPSAVQPGDAIHLQENDILRESSLDLNSYSIQSQALFEIAHKTKIFPQHLNVLAATGMWSGMRLPGKQGLLRKIQGPFTEPGDSPWSPLSLHSENIQWDDRFGLVTQKVHFTDSGSRKQAELEVQSLLRPEPVSSVTLHEGFQFKRSQDLSGKLFVVLGGSRGLGAKTVLSLAHRGAEVWFTYLKCQAEALELESYVPKSGPLSGKIHSFACDSTNAEDLEK